MENNFKELLGKTWKCACGRTHCVPVKEIYCGRDAGRRLVKFIYREMPGSKTIVISDTNTFAVNGESTAELLAENGLRVSVEIFPAGKKKLKAEKELADALAERIKEFDFAVACGSGTINDLVKYASTRAGIPYISCPSAPSMNGYPSPIAALSYKGTKKTLAAEPPAGVFADIGVICGAPKAMISAGFGDGISKSVCNIDWAVSRIIKKDYYCSLPGRLMAGVMGFYVKNCRRIAAGEPKAVKRLFEALNLAGISMSIAGSSAPASGGEHLISHFFDMFNSAKGKDPNLHGLQVGLATVLTAKLYEKLLKFDTDPRRFSLLIKHYTAEKWTKNKFLRFYGKKMYAEVYREFMKKYLAPAKKEKELLFILKNWEKIRQAIKGGLIPSAVLEKALKGSGAPVSFAGLGIKRPELKKAIMHAREVRGRYTVLDLAYDLDILESFAGEVV